MRLSRHFSPLVFVRVDFACTGRFRLQFVVRSVGSSVGSCVQSPGFQFSCVFLWPLWRRNRLPFSTLVRCFRVWSAVSDVVVPSSTMSYACTSFLFFSGSLWDDRHSVAWPCLPHPWRRLTIACRLQFAFCRHCLSAAGCLNSLFTFFTGR